MQASCMMPTIENEKNETEEEEMDHEPAESYKSSDDDSESGSVDDDESGTVYEYCKHEYYLENYTNFLQYFCCNITIVVIQKHV